MIQPKRKPIFENPEPTKTDFQQLVSAEFEAARKRDPNVSYETVLRATAQKYPELYEKHAYKIGGNDYAAADAFITPPNTNYFKQVSDLLLAELQRGNPNATYTQAASIAANTYPHFYEQHLAERTGIFTPQTQTRQIRLSEREEASKKDFAFDRLAFARRAFPFLVQSHLKELRRDNADATYEQALRATAVRFAEMHLDYQLATGA